MSKTNSDIVEEVKNNLDIINIISEYIPVKKLGNNYKAVCPFHSEKTPSFVISQEKQIYKCFGCNEGGDLINFVMKMENLEFLDALEILAKKAGVEFSKENIKDKDSIIKKELFLNMNLLAARYFFDNLWKEENRGLTYLKNRGLDDKIIKKFGLGFAPKNWNGLIDFLSSKNFKEESILECGLSSKTKEDKYRDKFVNRVIFPIFDIKGNVIGFGGRVLEDKYNPKYLNSPETFAFSKRMNLYGLNFAKKSLKENDYIILVEGYMDVISLNQFGIENVVATLGTSFTKEQAKLIKKYVNKIVIAYDSDQAGVDAAKRAFTILKAENIERKILDLKDCKDPDEFIRNYGLDVFKDQIRKAKSDIEFRILEIRKQSDLKTKEGIFEFIKRISTVLKGESPVKSEYYINEISKETNISADSIFKEIYGETYVNKRYIPNKEKPFNKGKNFKEENKKKFEKDFSIKRDRIKDSEYILIGNILGKIENIDYVFKKLEYKDFSYEATIEVLKIIYEKGKTMNQDEIKESIMKIMQINEDELQDMIKTASEFELDIILKGIKEISIQKEIEVLSEEQRKLQESSLYKNKSSEVDKKLLDIGIQIMEKREFLRKNK